MVVVVVGGLVGKGCDISLVVLQCYDFYINCIVDVVSQVVLYIFGYWVNEWVCVDVMGCVGGVGWGGGCLIWVWRVWLGEGVLVVWWWMEVELWNWILGLRFGGEGG